MCHPSCLAFGRTAVLEADVRAKQVLEVGSMDVNGSLRPIVMAYGPAGYMGVDLGPGPGVDEVCPSERLVERFGRDAFDLVLTTEMLEHVLDWRAVVHNLKQVVKPGGALIVTTRSKGYPLHGYPSDYWRFELDDFRAIFRDMEIEVLEPDPSRGPGVFMRARKPSMFVEADTDAIALHSTVARRRVAGIRFGAAETFWFRIRLWLATQVIRTVQFAIRVLALTAWGVSRLVPRGLRQRLRQRVGAWIEARR